MSDMCKKFEDRPRENAGQPVTVSRGANAGGAVFGLLLLAALGAVLVGAAAAASGPSRRRRYSLRASRSPAFPLAPQKPSPPVKTIAEAFIPGKPYPPTKALPTYGADVPTAQHGLPRPRRRLPVVEIFLAGMALLIATSFAIITQFAPTQTPWSTAVPPSLGARATPQPTPQEKTRPPAVGGMPSRR